MYFRVSGSGFRVWGLGFGDIQGYARIVRCRERQGYVRVHRQKPATPPQPQS